MEYPNGTKLDGPSCKCRPKITCLEVVNEDLKELSICKVDVLTRTRSKQLISKGSARGLLRACSLENE